MQGTLRVAHPTSAEWRELRENAELHRDDVVRHLRHRLAGDPRADATDLLSLREIAEEAYALAVEDWRSKPAAISPAAWLRRHALVILDAALDEAALAAEGADEERRAERPEAQQDREDVEEGRRAWFEMVDRDDEGGLPASITEELGTFDLLVCDPTVSSPEERMRERELLAEIGRALQSLPERSRRAVAHRYLDGLPLAEVAYLLECSEAEAQSEIAAGLAELNRRICG
jgi:RNA polymerase sigma factor (sigma-70 family)